MEENKIRFASKEDTAFWDTRRETKQYYEHKLIEANMAASPLDRERLDVQLKAHLFTIVDGQIIDRLEVEPELHEEFMANMGATPSQNEAPANPIDADISTEENPIAHAQVIHHPVQAQRAVVVEEEAGFQLEAPVNLQEDKELYTAADRLAQLADELRGQGFDVNYDIERAQK